MSDIELCVYDMCEQFFIIERDCCFSVSDRTWIWEVRCGNYGDRDLVRIRVILMTTGSVCHACLEFESMGYVYDTTVSIVMFALEYDMLRMILTVRWRT